MSNQRYLLRYLVINRNRTVSAQLALWNRALFDDPANEVVADVDMLGSRMVLVVFGKLDGGLIVAEKNGRREVELEELGDQGA